MSQPATQGSLPIPPDYMPSVASPIEVKSQDGFLYFKRALAMPGGGYRDIVVRMWDLSKGSAEKRTVCQLNPLAPGAESRVQEIYNAVLRAIYPTLESPEQTAVVFTSKRGKEKCFGIASEDPLGTLKKCRGRYKKLNPKPIDLKQEILPEDHQAVNPDWKRDAGKKVIDAMREMSLVLRRGRRAPFSSKKTRFQSSFKTLSHSIKEEKKEGGFQQPPENPTPPPNSPKTSPAPEQNFEIFTSSSTPPLSPRVLGFPPLTSKKTEKEEEKGDHSEQPPENPIFTSVKQVQSPPMSPQAPPTSETSPKIFTPPSTPPLRPFALDSPPLATSKKTEREEKKWNDPQQPLENPIPVPLEKVESPLMSPQTSPTPEQGFEIFTSASTPPLSPLVLGSPRRETPPKNSPLFTPQQPTILSLFDFHPLPLLRLSDSLSNSAEAASPATPPQPPLKHPKSSRKIVKAVSLNSSPYIYSVQELFNILNKQSAIYTRSKRTPFFARLEYTPSQKSKPQVIFKEITTSDEKARAQKHIAALNSPLCENRLHMPGWHPIQDENGDLLPKKGESLKIVRVYQTPNSYVLWGFSN